MKHASKRSELELIETQRLVNGTAAGGKGDEEGRGTSEQKVTENKRKRKEVNMN